MGSLALRGSLPSNSVIKMNEVNYERMLLMYECSQAGGSLITVTFTGRPGRYLMIFWMCQPGVFQGSYAVEACYLMCWLNSSLAQDQSQYSFASRSLHHAKVLPIQPSTLAPNIGHSP